MDSHKNPYNKQNNLWISTTGYRILLILRSLMQKSRTIDELVDIIAKNNYVNKAISKDTIRLDINTLKSAGCVISRPSKANNYKYELIKQPFVLNFSEEEIQTLINLRDLLANNLTIEEIFVLNELYKKIISLTFNEKQIDYIENTSPLINIDNEIYKQLSNPKIMNKRIRVKYKSPEFGEEYINIVPLKISYENEKLYLHCFNYKYNTISILNIERIIKIVNIDIKGNYENQAVYEVVFEVFAGKQNSFKIKENETIIEETNNKIVVKAKVDNEFTFIQRLLQLGTEFRVISPEFFKEKLINKLKQIQGVYLK